MYKLVLIISVLVAIVTTNIASATEVALPYGEFGGNPVNIVYDVVTRRVSIQAKVPYNENRDVTLAFLTRMVLEIADGKPHQLSGKDKRFIRFQGVYPIWGPYLKSIQGLHHNGDYIQCLFFAEGAVWNGIEMVLTVTGRAEKPPYSWYYDDKR